MTDTKIEWAEKTWNPVTGCAKVSPGCAHCYAETVAKRLWGKQYPSVLRDGVRDDRGKTYTDDDYRPRRFTDVQCHPDRLGQPLRWRKPQRVFVNSMSDLFHEDVPDAFIDRVFAVMSLAPQHQFQVLTKRPARMAAYCGSDATVGRLVQLVGAAVDQIAGASLHFKHHNDGLSGIRLPNVWLGVSVEDQQRADERIPLLLETPAAVRFLSCEPLLGPVDLRALVFHIDWAIIGGESGGGARPCDRRWIYDLLAQCHAADVPAFVKQLGARSHIDNTGDWLPLQDRKGGAMAEWPPELRVRAFPEVVAA